MCLLNQLQRILTVGLNAGNVNHRFRSNLNLFHFHVKLEMGKVVPDLNFFLAGIGTVTKSFFSPGPGLHSEKKGFF